MSRLLRAGLLLVGVSVLSWLFIDYGGDMGPCGPSSVMGLLAFIALVLCAPAAALLLLAYVVRIPVEVGQPFQWKWGKNPFEAGQESGGKRSRFLVVAE